MVIIPLAFASITFGIVLTDFSKYQIIIIMSDNLQVSKEFLAEEEEMKVKQQQQLGQTMPKSGKNGGPYPIQIKKMRRDEVFRLHFDYGYSARKIADMIKISRNTVNSDVNYWYSRLEQELESISPDACIAKIINRLESQRSRLREELDNVKNFQEKTSVNKMLLDIDDRLVQFYMKIKTTDIAVYDLTTKRLNKWMEEKKYDDRFITLESLCKFSSNAYDKIIKVMKEDKVQTKYT